MLRFSGRQIGSCTKTSRRGFLQAGALSFSGLTLADLLRAEERSGVHGSRKAIINVHLDGGPPQMDTIDPKPHAPVEFRGEFSPISTSLPDVFLSELMPQVASTAGRFAFLRSVVGSAGRHDGFQCQSGFAHTDLAALGGRPALGCVVSKLKGNASDIAPAFVDLMQGRPLARDSARSGFLGPSYQPFRPDMSRMFHRELEPGMKNELARRGKNHATTLTLNEALSLDRLGDRRSLLTGLDSIRRSVDESGMMDAMDRFQQQAVGILTSGRFAEAMDLSREDPQVIRRYTAASPVSGEKSYTSEGPDCPRKLLLARRLVEAGVRCVSVSISDFDTHSSNFTRMRHLMPIVDHGLRVLIEDLTERGMIDDVTVIAWGEFGRTPRINSKNGGRDHWPAVSPAIVAGGGLRTGVVVGATDRIGGAVSNRPVHFKDVFATLYRNLGIDARQTTVLDPNGRPQYLLDTGTPIGELIG